MRTGSIHIRSPRIMTVQLILVHVALLAITSALSVDAFLIQPVPSAPSSSPSTGLHGWLDSAFKNDDSLGKPVNAGLTNGPKFNENVTVNGTPVKGAVAGQKLTVVAGRARVKIPVNCQKGDCGTVCYLAL
jgi:hypothetical protein